MPNPTKPKIKISRVKYESNPFKLVMNGFNNVFNYNSSVTIILIIISIVILIFNSSLGSFMPSKDNSQSLGPYLVAAFVIFIASLVVRAVSWLLGIQSAKKKQHTLDSYFKHTMIHFWPLVGYSLLYGVLVTLGFMLFIIPGILFSYWYSQAPMIILDQNKPVFEAMRMSKKMVKGMFWEWAGVYIASSILSIGGILSVPSSGGGRGLFYQQLKTLKDSGEPKPKTSRLNYLLTALLVALIILAIAAMISVILLFQYDKLLELL